MARVLLLCTANQCRSPMAEGLLRARRPGLELRSAGRLPGGVPASAPAVAVLAEQGIDLAPHRSQTATRALVAGADLVVGMAREHVRDAVLLDPGARDRAFTLKELARRARAVGARQPGEPLDVWLRAVAFGRTPADLLGSSPADDVADPIGQPVARYRACVAELEGLLDQVVALAFPAGLDDDGGAG